MNMNNFAVLRGRLTADPAVFANSNGSSKVKFTIAAENNYKNSEGKREAQMIPVEAYVAKDYDKSPFAKIHKGDKVSVECSLRQNNYEKDGQMVYSTVVFVEGIQFEESKSVTDARLAARDADAATAAAATIAEAPAEAQA